MNRVENIITSVFVAMAASCLVAAAGIAQEKRVELRRQPVELELYSGDSGSGSSWEYADDSDCGITFEEIVDQPCPCFVCNSSVSVTPVTGESVRPQSQVLVSAQPTPWMAIGYDDVGQQALVWNGSTWEEVDFE